MKQIAAVSLFIVAGLLLGGCSTAEKPYRTGNANTATTNTHAQGSPSPTLPEFPWPPKASAFTTIPNDYLVKNGGQTTLKNVGDRLKQVFTSAGYTQTGYYGVPGGFAIVSPLEQFKADGTPANEPDRWTTQTAPPKLFSLSYFQSLIMGKPAGHYRIIVFIVTDQLFTATGKEVDLETGKKLAMGGAMALPPNMNDQPFGDQYTCTALIYEFERPTGSDQEAQFKASSSLMAEMHLRKSKILAALEK